MSCAVYRNSPTERLPANDDFDTERPMFHTKSRVAPERGNRITNGKKRAEQIAQTTSKHSVDIVAATTPCIPVYPLHHLPLDEVVESLAVFTLFY